MKKAIWIFLVFIICCGFVSGCGQKGDVPPSPTEVAPPQQTLTSTVVAAITSNPGATTPAPVTPTQSATSQVGATPSVSSQTPTMAAAALVNGEPIPLADYETQVALAESSFQKQGIVPAGEEGKAALDQVRRQVLDWMIDQLLIEQAARRMNIQVSDAQVEAEVAKAKGDDPAQFARWLQDNGLTEEAFKDKVRSELLGSAVRDAVTADLPTRTEQVRLRHILVSSESQAREILSQIKTSDDFVRLAQQYSLDMGTRETGGDLGFYPRGILSPEIDSVAFNMVVGQISDVIQTAFGFHIIQVVERDRDREILPEMMIGLRQEAFLRWLDEERAKATIEYLVP